MRAMVTIRWKEMEVSMTGLMSLLFVALTIAPADPTFSPLRPTAPLHIGRAFAIEEITPIAALCRNPERYFNRNVRIEGVIASACRQEGCFIEVVPENGGAEGILVNFPDSLRFPVDCAGRKATVEGMFYQKIYPASRVAHWQGHSFRQGKPVGEFSLIKRITAKAAELGERGSVPGPGDIVPAATDRIDLGKMEFEAEGFGTGKKVLEPGGVTDRHSTGKVREMIFCIEGAVEVGLGSAAPIELRAGEMAFIPPATEHELRNRGAEPAVYIFVYSRAPEEKHHEH